MSELEPEIWRWTKKGNQWEAIDAQKIGICEKEVTNEADWRPKNSRYAKKWSPIG